MTSPATATDSPSRPLLALAAGGFALANCLKIVVFRLVVSYSTDAGRDFLPVAVPACLFALALYYLVLRRRVLFIGVYALQTLLLSIHLFYFATFNYYPHVDSLYTLWPQVIDLFRHSAGDFHWLYLFPLVDLPFAVALVLFFRFPLVRPSRIGCRTVAAFLAAFLIAGTVAAYREFVYTVMPADLAEKEVHENVVFVRRYGVTALTLLDSMVSNNEMRRMHLQKSRRKLTLPNGPVPHANIVLIQIESMDARIVFQTFRGRPVMPYLNDLTRHSVYYPFTMSYHKGGGTSDCEFTVLDSIEPLNDTAVFFNPSYRYGNSVVNLLRSKGYCALAFHGNDASSWRRDLAFPKIGYEVFYDLSAMHLTTADWGASDRNVFDFAIEKLRQARRPFLAHVITMSSHFPYNMVPTYAPAPEFDAIADKGVRNYFCSMRYVDGAIQRFVEALAAVPKTFVFIYGDHTPPRIASDVFSASKVVLRDSTLEFVPCFILTPGRRQTYVETHTVASFLDLAPTILDAAGIGCDYATDGSSLLVTPIPDTDIPFREALYSRSYLMRKCRQAGWEFPPR